MKSWLSRFTAKADQPKPAEDKTRAEVAALITQGQQLEDEGSAAQALACYRQALALAPRSVSALINQGNACMLLDDLPAAIASYREAISIEPDNAWAWLNLGNTLLASKATLASGKQPVIAETEAAYRQALRLKPDWAEAWFGLGCALEETKAIEEACAAYRRALALEPAHPNAAFNLHDLLAQQLVAKKEMAAARALLLQCLEQHPENRRVRGALVNVERDSGQGEASLARLRQLVQEDPADFPVHTVLLFALNFLIDITPQELFEAHRRFGDLMQQRIAALPLPPRARDPQRRLRIGYVSPDFHNHPVAVFIIPVLRAHDRSQVEVYCYSSYKGSDDITVTIRSLSDHWREAVSLGDAALAQQVQADGIDLLIDLTGHTTDSRMGLFAMKPAPVQMTWLGYLGTTGLSRIDYRISDAHADPVGASEHLHTETLLRLPHSQWCYEPQVPMPAATPLPYLSRGSWTFGSYNNFTKLNPQAFATWAAVLKRFPGSRLKLFAILNEDVGQWVRAGFAREGITSDRIQCIGRVPIGEYFGSASEVDIALDSFPYSGGTTTCDTLMMGLPVATIAGARTISRSSLSLLSNLGLSDWIAESAQALPDLLQRQLADPARLASLRGELPGRLRHSPLMDAPQFTRDLEQLYRQGWQRWCADKS